MKNTCLLAVFGLLVGCTFSYSTILKNDFIYTWDDDVYVVDNVVLRELSADNLKTIFTSELGANYHPVTYLSLALEYQLFGDNAWGYHLMSLLLHLLCVGLVFYLTYLLFDKNILAGLVGGAVFGLHPMHVESVAWVSERKDVLFMVFLLGSLITYHFYVYKRQKKMLIFAILLAALSMFSKPAAVVLPALLLLMDWWYKRRISWQILQEKIVFGLLALVVVMLTLKFQSNYEALDKIYVYSLNERLIFAAYSWTSYLWKFFLPMSLSGFYPYPPLGASLPLNILVSPIIILLVIGSFFWKGEGSRLYKLSILFFTISLLPVLQIIPVGSSIISERYTYLPYVGLGFGIAALMNYLKEKYTNFQMLQASILTALAILMAIGTWQRCQVWKNDITFWSDVIEKQPLAINGYTYLGTTYHKAKEFEKSIELFDEALNINPDYWEALVGKGMALYELNDFKQAAQYFTKGLEKTPENLDLLALRGESFMRMESYKQAIPDFNKHLSLQPDAGIYNLRAYTFAVQNQMDAAKQDWERAISLGLQDANVYYNLSTMYYNEGDISSAIKYSDRALELVPEDEEIKSYRDSLSEIFLDKERESM